MVLVLIVLEILTRPRTARDLLVEITQSIAMVTLLWLKIVLTVRLISEGLVTTEMTVNIGIVGVISAVTAAVTTNGATLVQLHLLTTALLLPLKREVQILTGVFGGITAVAHRHGVDYMAMLLPEAEPPLSLTRR
jgi:hypothetical protein